jgi:bis(5'-nucleosyl)-tetraphosphatase (symmetrical)
MSTYAIGDVQGCFTELQQLLEKIKFNCDKDRLWFVGDLVNRGPDSLETLRFVKDLGASAVTVLGNHDLHLIIVAAGHGKMRDDDTLQKILTSSDRDELIEWLKSLPLVYAEENYLMVHAGLLPQWTIKKAVTLAHEVQTALQGKQSDEFIASMYGNKPDHWSDDLVGFDRLRVIVNAMTRMRFCRPDGSIDLKYKGEVEKAPPDYLPWFDVPSRKSRDAVIICGHWSALGLLVRQNLLALDSGCLWGGSLSCIRLEDKQVFQVPCQAAAKLVFEQ